MLDTSVIVDLAQIDTSALPHASSIAAITLAEMTVGIVSAPDARKLGDRISVLQTIESLFQVVSFDAAAARAYGRVYVAASSAGQKPRGRRAVDFLIAATALSRNLPLYTRNAADFASVAGIVRIVSV
jgi:predicted nucleic acid-binding protein